MKPTQKGQKTVTSCCLLPVREMSTTTQTENEQGEKNQLRPPLLIPQTFDNKSLHRQCN